MDGDRKILQWPVSKLAADYARGAAGVAVAVLCAFLAPAGSWWQLFLFAVLFLFLVFLADVLIRQGTRIVLTPDGLTRRRPIWGEERVAWSQIEGLDVRFYPTKRDRSAGWMTAKVEGPGASISMDDAMDGFEDVLSVAMRSLNARGLGTNDATAANLASLGLGLRPRASK